MIKVENIDVWGFEHAIRGMRNPMNSWDKSDSGYHAVTHGMTLADVEISDFIVGNNDLELMRKLYQAGSSHRKFMRQIFVSMDVVAPMYWWSEADTFKIGVTRNSCSKMHKIHSKEIELSDFSFEDYELQGEGVSVKDCFINIVADCEMLRKKFLETNDKKYWRALIQLLPESYNQRSTLTMNYENVVNIIQQRVGHKLTEWREFIDILGKLPYLDEITGDNKL